MCPPTTGTAHCLAFGSRPPGARIAPVYREVVGDGDPRSVLVLKRLPDGVEALENRLDAALDHHGRPRVAALPRHASTVVEVAAPERDRLRYEQRIELLTDVVAETDWGAVVEDCADAGAYSRPPGFEVGDVADYLATAATKPSFGPDLGQVLLERTRQVGPERDAPQPESLVMAAVERVRERFRDRLAAEGVLERAAVVPRAVAALEDEDTADRVREGLRAVLAVEFEEYGPLARAYLARVASGLELHVVGERRASVLRTRTETGSLDRPLSDDRFDFDVRTVAADDPTAGTPAGVARLLATGEAGADGTVVHLRAETVAEQLRAVAEEVATLLARDGRSPEDVAVVTNEPEADLAPARRRLRAAGIPTASAGPPTLADDPAVTELYALVRFLRDRNARARSWLAARVPAFEPSLADACAAGGPETTLKRWVVSTDLKGRIATAPDRSAARDRYRNVARVLELAAFVEATGPEERSLPAFDRSLERAIRFDAPHAGREDADGTGRGVTVTDVDGLGGRAYDAVFCLGVVESSYPGSDRRGTLVPDRWLARMPAYPVVTAPDPDAVADTFPPTPGIDRASPGRAYATGRARRSLAVATRAARERAYWCTYESRSEGSARRHRPSRFLREVAATEDLDVREGEALAADRPRRTTTGAADRILGQPWAELERVVRAGNTGEDVDLEETAALFGAVGALLDGPVDPALERAIRTQFELARGEVLADAG